MKRFLVVLTLIFATPAAAQIFNAAPPMGYAYFTPLTGTTVTISAGAPLSNQYAIINPAGTLATLTVQLPGCTVGSDSAVVTFGSDQAITALTVTTASGSVVGAGSSLSLGTGEVFVCRAAATTWYRVL